MMFRNLSTAILILSSIAFAQTPTEQLLLEKIAQLEKRLAALEAKQVIAASPAPQPIPPPATDSSLNVNLILDGYYAYNFNRPASRQNVSRVFDQSHNAFSLNQATAIIEKPTSLARKSYVGGRLDLQFGQATDTLQGNSANEPRPNIYRNIFQAYGTVLAPIGKGLTIDAGKFASALGLETNFTKDNFNYSRSFFFSFLPFYHMGLRATYPLHSKMSATYWLVNGANQTEDFNGFRSQAAILSFTPSSKLSGNFNYYVGRELPNGRPGRFHVLDTYWNWNATSKLTLAAEADFVINRATPRSAPARVTGGAGYIRYRFHPKFSLASRYTLLNDRGGLFAGQTQNLRDLTLTSTFELADGFQMRWEFRRDSSSHPFFPGPLDQELRRNQSTGLIGLIWWFGGKPGVW